MVVDASERRLKCKERRLRRLKLKRNRSSKKQMQGREKERRRRQRESVLFVVLKVASMFLAKGFQMMKNGKDAPVVSPWCVLEAQE